MKFYCITARNKEELQKAVKKKEKSGLIVYDTPVKIGKDWITQIMVKKEAQKNG